jgi:hypothetical protein
MNNPVIPIYRVGNPADLALAECLLTAHDIPYFVHNRHFGNLYPGAGFSSFNEQTIMVVEERVVEAQQVLADFLKETPEEEER